MRRDWRDERIQELEAQVREQARTIAALEQRVRELEARLAQTSGNSSRPPSSDPPGAPPPARPRHTGRSRGGQPGHERHTRELVPPDEVTRAHVIKPHACRRCGARLGGDDPAPYRHQVIEIPPVVATVEEYQLHTLVCTDCGCSTRAQVPEGVSTGQFGPRFQALVSLCSGDYRMSKRAIERLFEDVFCIPIALGTISNLEQATSEAIAAPVEEIARAIKEQPVVHADETGWYERGRRAWLWVAMTSMMAVFLIRASRSQEVAKELLGSAFAGILVSDRWSSYGWVDVRRRQVCWAHLLRHFRGFQDRGAEAKAIGERLELLTLTMFHLWHGVRDGTMSRDEFRDLMEPLKAYIVAWLRAGASCPVRAVAGRCREILKLETALWTFVGEEGIEPTNNAGERSLRHGVLWRKSSFGTDSPSGSRFVERILSVVTTLRLQGRNVLEYLTAACQAALRGDAAPSLLPV